MAATRVCMPSSYMGVQPRSQSGRALQPPYGWTASRADPECYDADRSIVAIDRWVRRFPAAKHEQPSAGGSLRYWRVVDVQTLRRQLRTRNLLRRQTAFE